MKEALASEIANYDLRKYLTHSDALRDALKVLDSVGYIVLRNEAFVNYFKIDPDALEVA